jgi:hypothetical protein
MKTEDLFKIEDKQFIIPVKFRGEIVEKLSLSANILHCSENTFYFYLSTLDCIIGRLKTEYLYRHNQNTINKLYQLKSDTLKRIGDEING